MKKSKPGGAKTDKLKGLKIGDTTLGDLLTQVMKVKPPKGKLVRKKAAKKGKR